MILHRHRQTDGRTHGQTKQGSTSVYTEVTTEDYEDCHSKVFLSYFDNLPLIIKVRVALSFLVFNTKKY